MPTVHDITQNAGTFRKAYPTRPHPELPAEVFEPVDEETDRLLHLFGGADIEYRED